jgi:hypothetical protein
MAFCTFWLNENALNDEAGQVYCHLLVRLKHAPSPGTPVPSQQYCVTNGIPGRSLTRGSPEVR